MMYHQVNANPTQLILIIPQLTVIWWLVNWSCWALSVIWSEQNSAGDLAWKKKKKEVNKNQLLNCNCRFFEVAEQLWVYVKFGAISDEHSGGYMSEIKCELTNLRQWAFIQLRSRALNTSSARVLFVSSLARASQQHSIQLLFFFSPSVFLLD